MSHPEFESFRIDPVVECVSLTPGLLNLRSQNLPGQLGSGTRIKELCSHSPLCKLWIMIRVNSSVSCPTQDHSAGLITGTGTVDNDIFVSRNERRLAEHVLRRTPPRARDKLRIGQEIEGLANIEEKNLLARQHHLLQSCSTEML